MSAQCYWCGQFVADADLLFINRGPDSYVEHADPNKCSTWRKELERGAARRPAPVEEEATDATQ